MVFSGDIRAGVEILILSEIQFSFGYCYDQHENQLAPVNVCHWTLSRLLKVSPGTLAISGKWLEDMEKLEYYSTSCFALVC